MLKLLARFLLVISLWSVFEHVSGQTCTFESTCTSQVRINYSCGLGQCTRYVLVYYNCDKTESCTNSFGPWSTCTASCSPGGIRQRTVTCTTSSGQSCISTGSEMCNTDVLCESNIDGNWGDWSSWIAIGSCSQSCCGGTQSRQRIRQCNNPPPSGTGATCPGPSTESDNIPCNTGIELCPISCVGVPVGQFFPNPCEACSNIYFRCEVNREFATQQNCSHDLFWNTRLTTCSFNCD